MSDNLSDLIEEMLQEHTSTFLSQIPEWSPWWNKQNTTESWTVGEVAEHIMLVESGVIKLLQTPSERKHDSLERFGLPKMRQYLVQGRQMAKVKAPEPYLPKRSMDPEAFSIAFGKQRSFLLNALQTDKIVIDNRLYKHPFLGDLTVADWLYSIITHAERHEEQIKEILETNS